MHSLVATSKKIALNSLIYFLAYYISLACTTEFYHVYPRSQKMSVVSANPWWAKALWSWNGYQPFGSHSPLRECSIIVSEESETERSHRPRWEIYQANLTDKAWSVPNGSWTMSSVSVFNIFGQRKKTLWRIIEERVSRPIAIYLFGSVSFCPVAESSKSW